MATYTIGTAEVSVEEYGSGRPFLLLHGGAGPQSVTGFAQLFAARHGVRVLVPTHPGFGGTPRPDGLTTMAGLAGLYTALLDALELDDVTVIGNSIGGWITAEIALCRPRRVARIVLVDAVGVEVAGHPVADFFALTLDQVADLAYHDPTQFRIDPSTLSPAAQAVAAGNRTALETYAGRSMTDPGLAGRLAAATVPALVLWGDSDRIVDPGYGRAYAAAIPAARFLLLPDTGHLPHLETPDQVSDAIWEFSAGPLPSQRLG